jgi:sigma-B regulation protein RsbU (phosphoserine phosphatase)
MSSFPPPAATRVLLVDDQAIVGESVRRMLAEEPGLELRHCLDPAMALRTANEFRPTVILQDLVMPEIDGLQLVKYFRANPATRETPMIVLSSKEEPVVKAKAFAFGANDYLVKLPDRLELAARVRYHSQGYRRLLERNEAYSKLAASEKQLAQEVNQAARYVQSLLPTPLRGRVQADWKFVPSTQLGGDMFGYHWLDDDHLALYLLDVSGHGVGSSLLAVSASTAISARSLPNTDFRIPSQVVERLNDTFQMDRQDGKYFTIIYAVYEPGTGKLRYANAAHPQGLLFDPAGRCFQLESDNPIIGMMPPGMPFEERETTVAPGSRLLFYSDGVYEVERADETFWPHEEFAEFALGIAQTTDMMDRLYAEAKRLRGGPILQDDFSILDIRFSAAGEP